MQPQLPPYGSAARARPQAQAIFGLWLVLALLALGAYLFVHEYNATIGASTTAAVATTDTAVLASNEQMEDTADHLKHARAELIEAAERARRVQTRIRQVSRGLDQNYLQVYRHRLDAADMDCNSALQSASRVLEEIEFAQANLTKRRESR